ncbi:MAG: DUF4234 domain-containing protein [Ruminiclostridium sp.]|nr:DUF4234 domain-containing protein [Ruminiclostridium sp.]
MNQRSIAPVPLITAILLCLAALTELTTLARGLTFGLPFLSSFSALVTFAAYVFFAVVLFLNRKDMLLYLAPAGLVLAAAIGLATTSYGLWHGLSNLCFLLAALVLTAWAACPFVEALKKHQPVTETLWFLPGILAFVAALLATLASMHIMGFLANILVVALYFLMSLTVVFPDGNPMRDLDPQPARTEPAVPGTDDQIPQDAAQPQEPLPTYQPKVWDGRCDMLKHILLLIFTFGVWYCIWIYRTTGFLNDTRDSSDRNPTNQLLLCIFVPFYLIYWVYQSAKRTDIQAHDRGIPCDLGLLCLVMAFFVPLLPPILMQDIFNRFSEPAQTVQVAVRDLDPQELSARLRTYKQLQEDGLISPEDYEAKKNQLLNL